jgi:hypothetical protein
LCVAEGLHPAIAEEMFVVQEMATGNDYDLLPSSTRINMPELCNFGMDGATTNGNAVNEPIRHDYVIISLC